jgi:hypothetical protein
MRSVSALLLVAALIGPGSVLAQTPEGQAQTSSASSPTVDAAKLGVDLSRIRRELVEAQEESDSDSPLRLRYTVQVMGTAPKIDLLEGFSLQGAIPYGAPTHSEVLEMLTPREYRSPVVPIYGLAALAAQKLWDYNKKRQCEAEVEEYRRLVMQGVAVAAPRCTQ